MTADPQDAILCPSGRCRVGSLLFGKVGSDGRVGLMSAPMLIGDTFVDEAKKHGRSERQFRFAEPCVRGACANWSVNRCTLADRLAQIEADHEEMRGDSKSHPTQHQECPIRPRCRWFVQHGLLACGVCTFVSRSP
jgi:hypothetical protein